MGQRDHSRDGEEDAEDEAHVAFEGLDQVVAVDDEQRLHHDEDCGGDGERDSWDEQLNRKAAEDRVDGEPARRA